MCVVFCGETGYKKYHVEFSVHKGSICSDSTFVHYNIWLYKYLTIR